MKHERIKEHDRDILLSRTQTSAVSEHVNKTEHYLLWDEVKLIDRDPHWYSRRVKEGIHIISDFTLTISTGTVDSPQSSSAIVTFSIADSIEQKSDLAAAGLHQAIVWIY